ncbi:unnamed protein product [Coccothraustes coccothraustes]
MAQPSKAELGDKCVSHGTNGQRNDSCRWRFPCGPECPKRGSKRRLTRSARSGPRSRAWPGATGAGMEAQQLGLDAVCSARGSRELLRGRSSPGQRGQRRALRKAPCRPWRRRGICPSDPCNARIQSLRERQPCGTATFPFVLRPFGSAAKGARVPPRRLRASAPGRELSVGAGLTQAGGCCKQGIKTSAPEFLCANACAG